MLDSSRSFDANVVSDRGTEAVIHEARQRFVATFSSQCDAIATLIEAVAELAPAGPIDSLRRMLNDIAGHANGIGFPTVSAGAAAIDALIADTLPTEFDSRRALELVAALREDFATDLISGSTEAATAPGPSPATRKILVVDDEAQAREGMTEYLSAIGYAAVGLPSADSLLAVARDERPDLILLDVGLPGIDGFGACRLLKTEPELADIPVIFLTAHGDMSDRLTGFALGAEEFLSKPVDMREVALRIQIQLSRRHATGGSRAGDDRRQGKSSYAAFAGPARETLAHVPAALALVRLPSDRRADASAAITGALRRRELIGRYDRNHLVVLMPETSEHDARAWLSDVIAGLAAHGISGVHAGIAASPSPGARTLEALLEEGDEALAEARSFDEPAATKTARPRASVPERGITVLLADGDPDVTRLIDSHLRAGGYHTVIAFDGAQAVAAVETHRPDVLVLELMLPKMSGFEVLDEIAKRGPDGPHVVVLSGRGREEDVTRAFAAGAADFMMKPFNVEELSARIGRLVQLAPHD
jgi:DNA-binding response OmpR family regulator